MGVRRISTRTHGVLDLVTAGTLLAAPKILELNGVPRAGSVLRMAGAAALGYSMITDYEFGAVKALPMPAHLAMDAASGALLASSPWLFGFAGNGPRYWLPHVVVGTFEMLAAATSKTG